MEQDEVRDSLGPEFRGSRPQSDWKKFRMTRCSLLRCFLLLPLMLVFLTACGSRSPEQQLAINLFSEMDRSPEAMQRVISNATIVTRDPNRFVQQHGTQVEYHALNGKTFLWYPGNRQIVVGEWKVQSSARSKTLICYRYGTNSFNPVTGRRGGAWECSRKLFSDTDILKGNPFNLKAGKVPLVIPDRGRYYGEHFIKWTGIKPTRAPFLVKWPRAESLNRKIANETK